MKIENKEQAFNALDTIHNRIPFDAIRFLYDYGKDEEILQRVIYNLENASTDSVIAYNNYTSTSPLWYGIVGESQLDKRLLEPTIKLFTTSGYDWDFLTEQGEFLIYKLCQEFGDWAISRCLEVCVELSAQNSKLPYHFLYECLVFAEEGKYENEILALLKNPEGVWVDAMISQLADRKFKNLLPRIKEIHDHFIKVENKSIYEEMTITELEETIIVLEGKRQLTEANNWNYNLKRGNWEDHYKKSAEIFKEDEPIEQVKSKQNNKKIGRNDLCFCGSGMKFKKCCINKYI